MLFAYAGSADILLGLAVVGGLLVSQVIALLITPVSYLFFDRFSGAGPLQITPEQEAAAS